jgi:hypothetical protein
MGVSIEHLRDCVNSSWSGVYGWFYDWVHDVSDEEVAGVMAKDPK